jgi:glycine betaine/proline transport system ATP-binding protein
MLNPTKIKVESLSKVFGPKPDAARKRLAVGMSKEQIFRETASVVAVAEISFTVGEGEIFVVMGLSGSGKSTLIRCLNRLIEPTSGQVYLDDEDILGADRKRLRELRRNKMSMVFQHFALFPHLTVAENAAYGLKVRGMDKQQRREKALVALEQVGLRDWADSAPRNLSGGMQQRVGLARGLAADSEILLMDEPFSALDPLIRRNMQQELLELQQQMHKTIVFITHDLNEALILGDQIAIMKDGRFVQVGSAQQIVAHPDDPYVAAFTQDVDRSRVFTLGMLMRQTPLLRPQDTTVQARTVLYESGRNAVYVSDSQDRPVGVVTSGDLEHADDTDLVNVLRRDFPRAGEKQTLLESFDLAGSGLPIAVTSDTGELRGTVDPLDILGALKVSEETEQQAAVASEQR